MRDKIGISYKKGVVETVQIYQRLKETRIDKDLTQAQVAEYLQTTRQQISKYENGIQAPTVDRLKALCILYGVSADYILGLPKGQKWPR